MKTRDKDSLNYQNLSFIDLWHVIIRYYYLVFISVAISLALSVFYFNINQNIVYKASGVIEGPSFLYSYNTPNYLSRSEISKPFRKYIRLPKERLNSNFWNAFLPDIDLSISPIKGNDRDYEVNVISRISSDHALNSFLEFQNLIKNEFASILNIRRKDIESEMARIDLMVANFQKVTLLNVDKIIDLLDNNVKSHKDALEKFDCPVTTAMCIDTLMSIQLSMAELEKLRSNKRNVQEAIKNNNNTKLASFDLDENSTFFKLPVEELLAYKTYLIAISSSETELESKRIGDIKEEVIKVGVNPNILLALIIFVGFGFGIILTFLANAIIINRKKT